MFRLPYLPLLEKQFVTLIGVGNSSFMTIHPILADSVCCTEMKRVVTVLHPTLVHIINAKLNEKTIHVQS